MGPVWSEARQGLGLGLRGQSLAPPVPAQVPGEESFPSLALGSSFPPVPEPSDPLGSTGEGDRLQPVLCLARLVPGSLPSSLGQLPPRAPSHGPWPPP